MHACMIHMLTTRLAPHDRLMCSQAAARQWILHTLDINGYTSRGPLHSMVVHTVVQWFASFCRVCRPRAIARSTSHTARVQHVLQVVGFVSLWCLTGSVWAVPGIGDGQTKHCSERAGVSVLGGEIYKDSKVKTKSFVF